MKNRALPSLLECAILFYCGFMAADLPHSWVSTPSVRHAWIAFLIWILPWVWIVVSKIVTHSDKGSSPILLGLAVISTLAGTIGSLHILNHFGFALALAGMLPYSWPQLIWLLTSLSWTPAFGYMTKLLAPMQQLALQIALAAIGCVCLLVKKDKV